MTTMTTATTIHRASPPRRSALRITVLAGGPGPEREVSLNSGRAVHQALQRLGHHAELRDINPGDMSALDQPTDFVFIALHGEFGEDGTLQAELDRRGLPYGGSGARASALAMDKLESKRRFERAGLWTPSHEVVRRETIDGLVSRFPLPAMVKPVASGSSVDTYLVRDARAMHKAASSVVGKYGQALVERYVAGPELTVGILGDMALPVCEIRTRRDFYDYQAKYIDNDTQYLFDIGLPQTLLTEVQSLSLIAHRSLGCAVFSRVDWKIDENYFEPFVLEINTIPGFTDHSLLPKAAARIGMNFDQLCERIIHLSLERVGLAKLSV